MLTTQNIFQGLHYVTVNKIISKKKIDCTSVNIHRARTPDSFLITPGVLEGAALHCACLLKRQGLGVLKVEMNKFNLDAFICQACSGFAYLTV